MATKQKYYGVRVGRHPGVYESWTECQRQVIKFPESIFKGFLTKDEAQKFITIVHNQRPHEDEEQLKETLINIYVDGSYAKGQYSWGIAVYKDDQLLFSDSGIGDDTEAAKQNNIAGEMAGVFKAIEWAETNNCKPITIHHDYSGLSCWADGSWKANNRFTQEYAAYTSKRLGWVRFNKVVGHTGNEGNELVDKLAKEALGIRKTNRTK